MLPLFWEREVSISIYPICPLCKCIFFFTKAIFGWKVATVAPLTYCLISPQRNVILRAMFVNHLLLFHTNTRSPIHTFIHKGSKGPLYTQGDFFHWYPQFQHQNEFQRAAIDCLAVFLFGTEIGRQLRMHSVSKKIINIAIYWSRKDASML